MTYTATYTLDKNYYTECFDQSLPYSNQAKPKYFLLVLLICLGLIAFYVLNNHYLGSFMFMLAVLECLSFYYKRPWWVARQMLSRASGSEVAIHFTEQGINAENPYKNYQLTWSDIDEVIDTPKGLLVKHKRGLQYISKRVLSEEMLNFINKRATQ